MLIATTLLLVVQSAQKPQKTGNIKQKFRPPKFRHRRFGSCPYLEVYTGDH